MFNIIYELLLMYIYLTIMWVCTSISNTTSLSNCVNSLSLILVRMNDVVIIIDFIQCNGYSNGVTAILLPGSMIIVMT